MNAREEADLITVTQAAELLGVSRQRCHALIKAGQLEVVRVDESFPGGRKLLDAKAVSALKRMRVKR